MEPGAITLEMCRRLIGRSILVSEDEILDAARRVYRDDAQLIEGAAAVAVAALLKSAADYAGETVVVVVCGGNVDPEYTARVKA